MAARKTSELPTRIWSFHAHAPVDGAALATEIGWRSGRYYNRLVEIERARHARYGAIRRRHMPELAALGVRRVSFGGGLSRAALGATKRVAEELLTSGTYVRMTEELLPADDWRGLFGG